MGFLTTLLVGFRPLTDTTAAAQASGAATLSVQQQEDLASEYRANLLRELSPDDWYRCYDEPKLTDFNRQPMYQGMFDALRKAGISDRQLKPLLQKQVFNQFVWILWLRNGGAEVPKELLFNCNNQAPAQTQVRRNADRGLLAALTKVLGQVLQAVGVDQRSFLAGRALREAADDDPRPPATSDEALRTTAGQGLIAAESIVRAYLPSDAAGTFQSDTPGRKAEKLVMAAQALTRQREWPNAFFLVMASAGGGGGAGYWLLSNHYKNDDHPDVKAWNAMTDYEKGEAVRRMYVDMLGQHVEIAAGRMTPEQYGDPRHLSLRYDWNRVVGEAFGPDVLRQYQDAQETGNRQALPGYRAEEIRSAAYAYMVAMQAIIVLSI